MNEVITVDLSSGPGIDVEVALPPVSEVSLSLTPGPEGPPGPTLSLIHI